MEWYLDVSSTKHYTIHLLKSQGCSLGNVILDECEALMFVGNSVPWQADILNWSEWLESILDRVFTNIKVDAANIDSTTFEQIKESDFRKPKVLQNNCSPDPINIIKALATIYFNSVDFSLGLEMLKK